MAGLRTGRPGDAEAERRALIARVRSTGAQGGRIDPHRSIATIELHPRDVLLAGVLAIVFVGTYLAALPLLELGWTATFEWLAPHLGLPGIAHRVVPVLSIAALRVPHFRASAPIPGWTTWWITFVVTALVLVGTLPMRARWLPLAYALRFAAALQATSLAFFALVPERFPYDLAGYVSGMMVVGAVLIGIVPVVFGLTYYLMDVGWSRKIGLTLVAMLHLAVLVPLQYALQSVILVHASLIVLPVCFILFGLLPEIMVLVALFGWGMSWAPGRARGNRQ